jgi:hypothetical protein
MTSFSYRASTMKHSRTGAPTARTPVCIILVDPDPLVIVPAPASCRRPPIGLGQASIRRVPVARHPRDGAAPLRVVPGATWVGHRSPADGRPTT